MQGPAGKDGLPGHPGQRGEAVSLGTSTHMLQKLLDIVVMLNDLTF